MTKSKKEQYETPFLHENRKLIVHERLYLKIEDMIGRGEFEKAKQLAEKEMAEDPIFALCVNSRISEKEGNYHKAKKLASTAISNMTQSYPTKWFPHLVYLYALWRMEEYDEALEHINQVPVEAFSNLIQGRFHNIWGLVHWSRGKKNPQKKNEFEEALKHHKIALHLRSGYPTEEAFSFNNMGNTFQILGKFDDALECYMKALKIREKQCRLAEMATTLRDIGRCKMAMEDFTNAKEFFLKALDIQKRLNNANDLAKTWLSLGEVKKSMGESPENCYLEAVKYAERSNNKLLVQKIKEKLGEDQAN